MRRVSERYRTALVTGAGSGLGAAFAGMLLADGVQVWGTTRQPGRLETAARFSPIALELADSDSIDAAWRLAEHAASGIDLLINNAGSAVFGRCADVPVEVWERQHAVLFTGPARLARLATAAMLQRERGCVVNVTSLAVEYPLPCMSGYNAAKSALAAFTASLASETQGTNVTVIEFRAGDFQTNFNTAMQRVSPPAGSGDSLTRTWSRLEAINRAAPAPTRAARDLRRALLCGRRGLMRSGGFFQARVAPLGRRVLPAAVLERLRRTYFHLD